MSFYIKGIEIIILK